MPSHLGQWMGHMGQWVGLGHLGNLAQAIAEDCGELLVLLSLVGVGNRESIEVEEGAEKPA